MKVIIFGGTGRIGAAAAAELSSRHEVITVGKSSGDIRCDVTDAEQVRAVFQSIGEFDAVISTFGKVRFAPFTEMTPDLYRIGLEDKLLGQVGLVLIGKEFIQDRGSFTLTSGILSSEPIATGSSGSMVNGALESFVVAAAVEMPRGIRINIVSPTVIAEDMEKYGRYFRGFEPVSVDRAALAYAKSVEGVQTGRVYRVPG